MKRVSILCLSAAVGLALFLAADPSWAGQGGSRSGALLGAAGQADDTFAARNPREIQIAAGQMDEQTANLPMGTIRLRIIRHVGGKTMTGPIRWQVMTYGKDKSGKRHQVAEVTDPTPELVLPAGWYVVHAHLPDKTIRHPVEVTAGRTFKYTLVKQ
jgi:hypothetical protein